MFGIKSQGEKNFSNCQNRTVPTTDVDTMAYGMSFGGWFNAKNPHVNGYRIATVNCAKLGEFSLRTPNVTEAGSREAIEKHVAGVACRGCMFAKMNPLEAQITLREIAEHKLAERLANNELRAIEEFFDGGPVPEQPSLPVAES